MKKTQISRRNFLKLSAGAGTLLAAQSVLPASLAAGRLPAIVTAQSARPTLPYGVHSGDILADRAILWAASDRPARMIVEWDTVESMANPRRITGPAALEMSDYTAKLDVTGLPAGQDIFYRVTFQSLEDVNVMSEPMMGHLRTAPAAKRDIRFVWSGDTAGQGWGINLDFGGMRIYDAMANLEPDFFIHSGDTVYPDNPMQSEVELADGSIWTNVMIEEKAKVAETLHEFRRNYAYNMLDENVRRFNAQVPAIYQWDDHETTNNWYPSEVLTDDRYSVRSVALLAARAAQAFFDYNPIRQHPTEEHRIYRAINYGPSLDVFMIDKRSYRGPNTTNDQTEQSDETRFLGPDQIRWLKQQLLGSTATWKVIGSDMPLGLIVRDGAEHFENGANGDGPALGRELEIADILSFIKANDIRNVVWLTADVHYTAAHYYDPNAAQFTDFNPFYEFVSGPLNSGTFGPNDLDNTFGPQVLYVRAPEEGQANLPPSAGMQFFGEVLIDGATDLMTVNLRDIDGNILFTQEIEPA
ncbi:MAG: twin-arginine translocation signal domain-containing protein [Chloroflexi bacterium]|nr:twin-arginine translocation signal domain-containing protein [Chloroflexota bacterium]